MRETNRARLLWAFASASALCGTVALAALAIANGIPAAELLMFSSFAAPFGVGYLTKRRHPELSAWGFGGGVVAGLLPGALIITLVNRVFPEHPLWVLPSLPVAFAALVGCAYLGSGWSILPREHEVSRQPEAGTIRSEAALAMTRDGVERILAFERRNLFVILGLSFALLLFLFGRSGLLEEDRTFVGIVVVVVLVAVVTSQRRQFQQKRNQWESLQISLSEDTLSRHLDGVPDLELPLREITKLHEGSLGLTVRGRDRQAVVFIPAGLESFSDLRGRLSRLREIEPVSTGFRVAASLLLLLAICAVTLGFMFWDSPAVVAPLGALLLALLCWSFVELGRSRLVDWRFKRMRWFFIPVILGIVGKMALLLGIL